MAEQSFPVQMKIERFFDKRYDLVYNLSASDPEALVLDDLLSMADPECLELWNKMKFGYTEMAGHPLLRKEISKLHGVKPDEILEIIPIEGIFIAMQCLVHYLKRKHNVDKLHAVTTFPAYQSLQENLRMHDCAVSDWNIRCKDGNWYFDIEDLKQQIKDSTKLIVVNFPHNPSGANPSSSEWKAIIDLCKEKKIFLFSDEMYRLTNLDGTVPLSSACAQYDECISLSGLSKTFALPGLRLGWLCTRNKEILQMMQHLKDYTSVCGPLPCEVLGIITLRNKDKFVKRTVDICQTNLAVYDKFFTSHPDLFEWRAPTACTTGLLRLKGRLLQFDQGGATGFCDALLRETGVVLLPTTIFNYKADDCVRLGFGRVNAPEGLEKLKGFIESHK